ncbi:hypothetical protein [Stenotrophomonas sp. Marseille-Q4652]|uniref:hypothetical protein n=1 Tax=Stenotrophomonas sp. Marseille-Q4652 TaxID=2866595 RepID=UPI001CE3F92C|nr:hypothetical protein [Stenotrophomonas sp. Marseille-Q4652]
MKINPLMAAMLLAGGLLAGCGDKSGGDAASAEGSSASASAKSADGKNAMVVASKDDVGRDITVMPFRSAEGRSYAPYMKLGQQFYPDSPEHLAYVDLYWSKADPIDEELLAYTISKEFANEQDPFKRKDMLAALKPKMDEYLARVRQIGDIAIDINDTVQFGQYDMEKKAFPIFLYTSTSNERVDLHGRNSVEFSVVVPGMDLANSSQFWLPMDEAAARAIEAKLAGKRDGSGNAEVPLIVKGHVLLASAMPDNGGEMATVNSARLEAVVFPDAFDLLVPGTADVLVTLDKKVLPAGFPADKYFLTRPYDNDGAASAALVKARMGIED